MKIGSLFSGYSGLEMGVQAVLGGTVAWHSEIDAGACKILAHRYPDVPNLGDITAVDWSAVEPVDVLTGGFPCQDVSHAGKRAGLRPDTRSGLWSQMAYAIDRLRPRLVVAENVRGLLSAEADGDLEPCPWCVGDGEGSPLRALGAVLGDLAELGYDAAWRGVRASDVGAPHGRFRVFVVAWPVADATSRGADAAEQLHSSVGSGYGRSAADPADDGRERRWLPRDGWPGPANGRGRAAADAESDGRKERRAIELGAAQPRSGVDRRAAADTVRGGRDGWSSEPVGPEVIGTAPARRGEGDHGGVNWGPYAAAVHRWERLTRPAPPPTEHGKNGQPRLSPAFVEWLMGLPAGWVTDVPGLTRNEQLKAFGNGVVPQQAAHALRLLLADVPWEVAA